MTASPKRSRRARKAVRTRTVRSASPRSGFTLVELMVALSLGAVVLASVYTIGASSARHFQEQQRISQLQLGVRIALDRVRRDVSLAGFGTMPNSFAVRSAGAVAGTPQLLALQLTDHDATGMAALATLPGTSEAGVHSDSLRIIGNFDTSDTYLVRDYDPSGAINLQTDWQGFRRSFMATEDGLSIDTSLFEHVFAAGRVVHVYHPTTGHYFAVINSATADPGGATARITLTSALPAAVDVCLGCTIAPLSGIEYVILPAAGVFVAPNTIVTGENTVLARREFSLSTGAAMPDTTRTILEWAVHFDADLYINTAGPGAMPNITRFNDGAAAANAAGTPTGITSVDLTLAARTPEQDDNFPWEAPLAGAPLTRFRPFVDRDGACRVRSARAEIFLPSIAYR